MSEHIGAEAEYWRDRYNAGADLLHQMEVERDAARAEVVRLRRELHQWEMSAATLARVVRLLDNNPNAATFDRDDVAGAVGDQLAAARLLGGGE